MGEQKMEQTINENINFKMAAAPRKPAAEAVTPGFRAFQILRAGFTVIPVIAGLDKFFHLLVDWDKYLPPAVNRMTGGHGHELMLAAGVVEIIAGGGVWLKPRIFAYIVAGWLVLIIINLLIISSYFDIILRDFGLALGALVLGQLSQEFSKQAVKSSKRAVRRLIKKRVARGEK
jgi:hypothetical protein